ncbi:hypothetical protein IB265_32195 [Ensifer sp. ENS10]|uniref:hypothetical protein n=1 Tax=unclassified Ensifer TaxID=2633371 RepID=UPI00070E74EB|nr:MULTISPECIES: hypothetical protein [unclassified Ensifer]KRD64912.1 hypothetical protein ASE60_28805 [Ensifer sp. Root278]MBD9511424.1 hypothetical protein [Ensifer sp. ENS10]MBV7521782.1 hypothetical protein [Ensifer sp. ENS12]
MNKKDDAKPSEGARIGATTDLPHDRVTVERFREAFPRARWSDRLNAWFVPGRTAERRIGRWRAELEAQEDIFADEKGRDAFVFEPIESRYLNAGATALEIRTPYSRSIVNEIREIPYARWDADRRLWTVPYRSLFELRQRWADIEAEAERSEPEARKARRDALKGTEEEEDSKARARERRRKRYPISLGHSPPFERAIATHVGVVFFTGTNGELADAGTVSDFYFPAPDDDLFVWATWRRGSLEELVRTWPERTPPTSADLKRGWWFPMLDELRQARREARSKTKAGRRNSEKSQSGG